MILPTPVNALLFTLKQQADKLSELSRSCKVVPVELQKQLDDHVKTFEHLEKRLDEAGLVTVIEFPMRKAK